MVKNIDLSDLIKVGDKIDWVKSSQENKVVYCNVGLLGAATKFYNVRFT